MITIVNANAKQIPLPDQSVQCIVTSPPYFGLRDYGTAKWEGGSAECDHIMRNTRGDGGRPEKNGGFRNGVFLTGAWTEHEPNTTTIQYTSTCSKCGARRIDAQIGLEPTPAAYVASIVAVMRECWRVLKDDGVLWLNLGDSYTANGGGGESRMIELGHKSNGIHGAAGNGQLSGRTGSSKTGLKPKDLCGIPWRVAFALQDAGWYLRQDIIWSKPNPMPESVTDRCTKAHEYVFLLSKQARYYYDAEAIKEQHARAWIPETNNPGKINGESKTQVYGLHPNEKRSGKQLSGFTRYDPSGRNRRSVWTVATSPYSGSHFATFPPKLVEPMILAGSKRGDVVLDPFAGSGTVGKVAIAHGRRAVMLDLNLKYIDLQFERTSKVQIGLAL